MLKDAQELPDLALELDLTLGQTFEKKEATEHDVMLVLLTVWQRGRDIPCSPDLRFAFHCAVMQGGFGGWRPGSTIELLYEDTLVEWIQDIGNPGKIWPIATITIRHVKQRKKVRRDQRDRYVLLEQEQELEPLFHSHLLFPTRPSFGAHAAADAL